MSDVSLNEMLTYLKHRGYNVTNIMEKTIKIFYDEEVNKEKNTVLLDAIDKKNDKIDDKLIKKKDNKNNSNSESNSDSESSSDADIKQTIDEKTPKVQILLKILNGILENLGKAEIKSIYEFVDMDKDDLLLKEHETLLDKYEKDFFKYYDKIKSSWYRRGTTAGYLLVFLRCACKQINVKFTNRKTQIKKKNQIKTITLLSIV